jgi:hypothetical protein
MNKIKDLLCYDIATCPPGLSLERVFHIMKTQNILLYSSKGSKVGHLSGSNSSIAPYIINKSNSNKVKILDVNSKIGEELIYNLTKN